MLIQYALKRILARRSNKFDKGAIRQRKMLGGCRPPYGLPDDSRQAQSISIGDNGRIDILYQHYRMVCSYNGHNTANSNTMFEPGST